SPQTTEPPQTTAGGKASPRKAASIRVPATKTPATKTPATKIPATKAAATKTTPTKRTVTKTTAAGSTATKRAATQSAARKAAPAQTAARKGTAGTRARSATRTSDPSAAVAPTAYAVKAGETAWTADQLAEIRATIESDMQVLREEITMAQAEVVALMRQSGDGAGDDQADAGSKTLEREQEMSLANNAREMLLQDQHALDRLANGTYGVCESCGQPIGKLRLEAAPRATLCVPCKTKQERR
ncbi:MAG: TraR/DksA C4-type zinc finger protein, partial [Nostocoides sp.]